MTSYLRKMQEGRISSFFRGLRAEPGFIFNRFANAGVFVINNPLLLQSNEKDLLSVRKAEWKAHAYCGLMSPRIV